ncbi:terminal uridylyltransferase 4 isoform X2 [Phascolarctos cinereus]|uniref:Terminal uridylyltransferase 4 isoform X2 n=1 Tax=Phascolarctos cinereus TaxID=38626 RepID=A0A6P5KD40_PHACI|nr:terminal uridylyltransferase 4 isoform X2 [Phascolarctos cinereus]
MEESTSSKNGNHEPRKSTRVVCEESKAPRASANQNLRPRNDRVVRDIGRSSPSGNSNKKNKQNDVCTEKIELKSCKVNTSTVPGTKDLGSVPGTKDLGSVPGTKDLGSVPGTKNLGSVLQDQSHCKAKKSPGPLVTGEGVKPVRAEQVEEDVPSTSASEKDVNKETLPTVQKGKSALETAPGSPKLKTCTDNTSDSGNSISGTEDKSDDLSKMKSAEPTKDPPSELDYLENVTTIDESMLTPEQKLGLKQAEERLERDYIFRLEKRSPEYTNCRYLCKLCLVHIENIQGAHKHIKEKRHKKNITRSIKNTRSNDPWLALSMSLPTTGPLAHPTEFSTSQSAVCGPVGSSLHKALCEKQEENELRALPPPSPAQLAALSSTLMQAAKEQGISDTDFGFRQEIVTEMEKVVQQRLPDCSLRLYGSSLTRFAFKSSDVNIDVKFPPKMSHPDVLIQVLDILKNCALYSEVESDFHAKVPVVFCKDVKSGLTCKVSAGNDVACLTTDLLAALGKLEPVLTPLVLAFRYWARLCHIDCQAEGGIPSYSFALMVMFFLQQRKPPLLPSYLGSWIEGFDSKRVDDHQLKGIEDEKFVKWEYKPMPSGPGKNSGASESKAKADQRSGAKKPSSSETDPQSGATKERHGKSPLALEIPNQVSLGQLWLELLKFYTLEFALEEYVISVRVQELLTRENKNWPKRRIAIEDPFALKRNVARSLNSQMVFEYILERFRTAYKYFACPQSKDGNKSKVDSRKKERGKMSNKKPAKSGDVGPSGCPLQGESVEKTKPESRGVAHVCQSEECDEMECASQRGRKDEDPAKQLDAADSSYDEDAREPWTPSDGDESEPKSLDEQRDLEPPEPRSKEEAGGQCTCPEHRSPDPDAINELEGTPCRSDVETPSLQPTPGPGTDSSATSPHCQAPAEACDLKDEDQLCPPEMHYVFDKFILTSGKPPTIVCSICKRDGHSKNDCPDDFKKIDLKPLPPMTYRFRDILDLVCKKCFDELSPPFSEQQSREQILASLERFIQKEYNEKARLCLFGSSKNGFGFRDSDLDICMTLDGHENAEKLNCKEIIEGLAKILKRHPGLKNILPITTAKVPIVKFEHRRSGLEGDISLYNTLAQHNTRMLATYAAIDPRVQYLGYTMKVFAKRCDIGDASRGSLSSYAYILMVLYFLQQRDPPVIPVLQEIFDGKQIPQRMVDGWNAFFFDDMEELKKRLPSLGQNTETLGELWLGLLRFYTEEFDFKEYVISIRQKKLLTTFEKQWTSKCIAIEDPFDLNHNLGAGVSRKMTNFIMKAFINGRKLFGTPFYPLVGREAEYFFDSKVLTDGELAPNDRCCRVCGKIGHYMKDCPKRRRLKKKENEKEDEKEMKDEDRELREKRCFICGDVGHVRRECPEYKQARQRNNGLAGAQLVRSLVSAPAVAGSVQQQVDRPSRTRQPSECSDSQPSSYSPQPPPFPQNSPQPASLAQATPQPIAQPKHGPPPAAQPPHQVQLPLFNFPQSPPGQYSALHSLGLLQVHPHPHPIPLPGTTWPMHGPVIHSAPGNPAHPAGVPFPMQSGGSGAGNGQNTVSLNDPSIIFAQPAARPPLGIPASHEGHWHSPVAPSSLVNNGAVGNSDQGFQGQFAKLTPPIPWDHGAPAHFPILQASWPYGGVPQNFLQQGNASFQPNKAFYPPGDIGGLGFIPQLVWGFSRETEKLFPTLTMAIRRIVPCMPTAVSFSWPTDAKQPEIPSAVSRAPVPQLELHPAEEMTFRGKQSKSGPGFNILTQLV